MQRLPDLLAVGLSSGEPQAWEKDAFLQKVKSGMRNSGESRYADAKGGRLSGWQYFGEHWLINILISCRRYFSFWAIIILELSVRSWRAYICLPFERYVIYFLLTEAVVIVIGILSLHQDAGSLLHWWRSRRISFTGAQVRVAFPVDALMLDYHPLVIISALPVFPFPSYPLSGSENPKSRNLQN